MGLCRGQLMGLFEELADGDDGSASRHQPGLREQEGPVDDAGYDHVLAAHRGQNFTDHGFGLRDHRSRKLRERVALGVHQAADHDQHVDARALKLVPERFSQHDLERFVGRIDAVVGTRGQATPEETMTIAPRPRSRISVPNRYTRLV